MEQSEPGSKHQVFLARKRRSKQFDRTLRLARLLKSVSPGDYFR